MLKKRNVDHLISRSLPKRNHQFNSLKNIQGLNPRFTKLSSQKFHPYLMGIDVDHMNNDFRTQLGVAISSLKKLASKLYSKRVLITYALGAALIFTISSSTMSTAKILPKSNGFIASSSTDIVQMSASIVFDEVPTFVWPVPYSYISTPYSRWHPGIDLPEPLGTPIHPAASGTVTEIENGFFGYGKEIVVTHGSGYQTRYAHMSKINVKVGDKVDLSTVLGNVGSTGHSTGNHLHFEIYSDGTTISPTAALTNLKTVATTSY